MKTLPAKDVACACGNTLTLTRQRDWCLKCGQPVFYNPKDKKWHKINRVYIVVMFAAAVFIVAYLFFEMIVIPLVG
jgi:hypothetical protein